ncbi:hypothetical protein Tco_0237481 [Tanacetum coccineum]
MRTNTESVESFKTNVSSLNFFDCIKSETVAKTPSQSPNDDEEGPSGEENSSEGNVSSNIKVSNFEYIFPNQIEEASPYLRRSQRHSKFSAKLNEFVLDGKVKYRLNRYANHSLLSGDKFCFVPNLNMSSEPSFFEEASRDVERINAMNDEMNALYENDA